MPFQTGSSKIGTMNYAPAQQSNNVFSISATNVIGNITLITSLGQTWYQQGIYGPNASGNVTIDKSWGWTFFDETPPSGFITPSERNIQRTNIYALLLDSGNNSNPITGAQLIANITYWTYDGRNYTNHTKQVQLTEQMNQKGYYSGRFDFYGGTYYYGYDMMWCDGCHLSYYTSTPDSTTGYFPGIYTAIITARASGKEATSELNFEVTPWGCEDCHGSGDQHRKNQKPTMNADMDSACYLCHGISQITHDGTDAGNTHQNTAHITLQCIDCHTNKSLNPLTFNGITFSQGGINNASLPQYTNELITLNKGTHTSLTCIDCHNNLTLTAPQGGYKQDSYTIKSIINDYTSSFASIQEFQDYYIVNVSTGGSLNLTLDWEGSANIGFYLFPPNFNPRNRTDPLQPYKGDYPYYNGSNFIKPQKFANDTPIPGKWILAVYGYDLTTSWIGILQPPINYTINSTYSIQQESLPLIPECNNCHNSTASGKANTQYEIPNWNPGFAHVDTNNDGKLDIQCRMCHNAMHDIITKTCQTCHTTAPANHPVSEPQFSQYTQSQCLSCHGDPHRVTVTGGGCIGCHSSEGTRYYVNTSIFGLHANLNTSEGLNLVNDSDCKSCHFDPAMPMVLGIAGYNNTYFCEDCHVSGGRNPSQYSNVSPSLRKTTGGHGLADCKWCHIAGWNQTRPLSESLRFHPGGPKGTANGKNC
ncbi:MAG TPA: cytochrome c3 family protein, partial [Candidatus Methanoperedens sp.]